MERKIRKGSKKPWSSSDDEKLSNLVESKGNKWKWSKIAESLNINRTGKQCRERYNNHLRPEIKKGEWSEDEDQILLSMNELYGNKWTLIAQYLPGRSDNSIKNRWHVIVRNQDDNGDQKKLYESHSDSSDHEAEVSSHPILSSYPAFHDSKPSTTPRFKRCHSLLYDGAQQQLESSRSFSFLPFEEIESNIVTDKYEDRNGSHCLSPHSSSDETVWMDDFLVDEDKKPPADEKDRDENTKKTAPTHINRMPDRATISVDDLRPGLFQDMMNNKR
eukprot:gene25823-34411_t